MIFYSALILFLILVACLVAIGFALFSDEDEELRITALVISIFILPAICMSLKVLSQHGNALAECHKTYSHCVMGEAVPLEVTKRS